MIKKKFIDLKEGDSLYKIKMTDCELGEGVEQLEVSGIIRTTDMYSISIRTKEGGFFTTQPSKTSYISVKNVNDEVNLSFDVISTTKAEAIDDARRLVDDKSKLLGLIKRRINDAETTLILADASLEVLEKEAELEPSLEEFASMALD
jgi:hypothetical protein